MSEISDAVQIIRVAFDGVEVAMKVGSASIESMQKMLRFINDMLNYEKQMGKTNMKQLLMRGGDLQVLQFKESDMKQIQKLAKKYGILYSVMPETKDGICEVLFHSEATPRVQMMIQKMSGASVTSMDGFLRNKSEEELKKMQSFFESQKRTAGDSQTESQIDNLIQKVGQYAMEKQSVSVDAIKDNFSVETDKAQSILQQLHKIGILDKEDEKGEYKVVVEKEAFDKKISRFQELTTRMKGIAASKNTDLDDITIAKKMIIAENDHAIKTRIPGTWGEKAQFIWINKSDVMEIHNGKTLLTYLDRNKDYKIYSEDNRVIATMKGQNLYQAHYDPVAKGIREQATKTEVKTKVADATKTVTEITKTTRR